MRMHLFIGLALSGCAATRPPSPASSAPAQVIEAQYAAIERGELEAWAKHFAEDALLLGTAPNEVQAGRAAILATVREGASQRMRPEVKRSYRSNGKSHIGLAPDGKSAWYADEIAYRVESPEGTKEYAFRMTSLLAEKDGAWSILASCYSVAVPDEHAFATEHVPPAPIPELVGPGAESIAELAQKMDEDPAHFAGRFSDHADVFLFGTSPAERVVGGPEVRRFTRQDEPPGKVRMKRTSGVAAQLAPSGTTGWLAYNATIALPIGEKEVVLPVRVLAVVLREGDTWLKVQEHVSIAVPD